MPTTLEVQQEVTLPQEGGTVELKVTTNAHKWSVTNTNDWLTVVQKVSAKSDEALLSITAVANPNATAKEGKIIVTAGELKKEITVKQSALIKVSYIKIELDKVSALTTKSKMIDVLDPTTKAPVAMICQEWIKTKEHKGQLFTLYAVKDGKVDFTKGTLFEKWGKVDWNLAQNSCTWNNYKAGQLNTVAFIGPKGEVAFAETKEMAVQEAELVAHLLTDKRGDEEQSYALVKIGKQIWMAENLRTLKFRDGSDIRQYNKKSDWESATESGVTYYDKKVENLKTLGALYNWFTTVDAKGLAPKDFEVPTDKQWEEMIKYVQPESFGLISDPVGRESEEIAPLLKALTSWKEDKPEVKPTALTGFDAIAAGSTSTSKWLDYSGKERQAYFWTSTPSGIKNAKFRRLYYDENFINSWEEVKTFGYSVRCVKVIK